MTGIARAAGLSCVGGSGIRSRSGGLGSRAQSLNTAMVCRQHEFVSIYCLAAGQFGTAMTSRQSVAASCGGETPMYRGDAGGRGGSVQTNFRTTLLTSDPEKLLINEKYEREPHQSHNDVKLIGVLQRD